MRITDIRARNGRGQAIEGTIGEHTLWFDFRDRPAPALRADPFLAAAFLPAMARGEAIEVDDRFPVSPQLLAGLAQLQEIYLRWYSWARPTVVQATNVSPAPVGDGTATLFSGGVDSSYTVVREHERLSHLLLVDRVDLGKTPLDAVFNEVIAEHTTTAAAVGVKLAVAHTNIKDICHAFGLDWSDYLGPALSAVAMAGGFATLFIPSSASWADLTPAGSHPVTDPKWSTEGLQIVHHGCGARRIDKLAAIAVPGLPRLTRLRVCLQGGQHNCGRCEKCLRTMAGARALGLTIPTLPRLDDLAALRQLNIRSQPILEDWIELLDVVSPADDPEFFAALSALIKRIRVRWLVRDLDHTLTGGRFRRILHRD
jgi:hypothetical protein